MKSTFEQNAKSWGKEGEEWLASIPSILKEYEELWSFKALRPFPLSYNYVAPVERADGTEAVIKIGFPKDKEIQSEIQALRIANGAGMVGLLEADAAKAVFLVERVVPGTLLSEMEDDEEATRTIARLSKRIRKPLSTEHSLIPAYDWSSALRAYSEKYSSQSGPLPEELTRRAVILFEELTNTSAPSVLVHGDLHHDNVLYSKEDGWIAIDPKGIAAEPAYEVAAMIRNPYEKLRHIPTLSPLLKQRLRILSEELEVDIHRLRDWCLAQTVLSAVWSLEEVKTPDHALRVAAALYEMKL